MLTLENYDIAFSRVPSTESNAPHSDPTDTPNMGANPPETTSKTTSGSEVVLLIVERADLPKIPHPPHEATLLHTVLGQHSIQVVFSAPPQHAPNPPAPNTPPSAVVVECLNVPPDVFDALQAFDSIWFCTVDKEQIVSEHNIPLLKSSRS